MLVDEDIVTTLPFTASLCVVRRCRTFSSPSTSEFAVMLHDAPVYTVDDTEGEEDEEDKEGEDVLPQRSTGSLLIGDPPSYDNESEWRGVYMCYPGDSMDNISAGFLHTTRVLVLTAADNDDDDAEGLSIWLSFERTRDIGGVCRPTDLTIFEYLAGFQYRAGMKQHRGASPMRRQNALSG